MTTETDDTPESRWDGRVSLVRRLMIGVLVAGVAAFLIRGAIRPDDPSFVSSSRRPLPGFEQVAFTVTSPRGRIAEWCALLADTDALRAKGLMDQTDLRGYDGMLFRWTSPVTSRFYMFDTKIPLSIAWFDQQGTFVGDADMEPCRSTDPAACETFGPERAYVSALEVAKGGLRALGIREGSELALGGEGCR